MERYLFDPVVLPEGFQYPKAFLELAEQKDLPDLFPWQFLFEDKVSADGWLEEIQRLYPSRKLVPFANWSASDDFACFEASYPSEDPCVHYIHAYASPGWEQRGKAANFSEWLEFAAEDAENWRTGRDAARAKRDEGGK